MTGEFVFRIWIFILLVYLTSCTHPQTQQKTWESNKHIDFISEINDYHTPIRVSSRSVSSQESCTFQLTIPQTFESGFLEVPEDPSRQVTDRNLKIFYYTYRPAKMNPSAVPIIFFNGGPGGPSHGSFEIMAEHVKNLDVPITFFDYRGAGCSSAFPDLTPENFSRFGFYNSRYIANDAELLRRHIYGPRKIIAFGHSYGSKLAIRYAELHPGSLHSILFMGDTAYRRNELTREFMESKANRSEEVIGQSLKSWRVEYPHASEVLNKIEDSLNKSAICFPTAQAVLRTCGVENLLELVSYLEFESSRKHMADFLSSIDTSQESEIRRNVEYFGNQYTMVNISPHFVIVKEQDYPFVSIYGYNCSKSKTNRSTSSFVDKCTYAGYQRRILEFAKVSADPAIWEQTLSALAPFPSVQILQIVGCQDAKLGRKGSCPKVLEKRLDARWSLKYVPATHSGLLSNNEVWEALIDLTKIR